MNHPADSVDNVIDRLSEIEANAVQILEQTEDRKKILSENMEKDKMTLTKNILRETEDKLQLLGNEMNLQKEKELAELEKETGQTIRRMQEKYDREYDEMISKIVEVIVKV